MTSGGTEVGADTSEVADAITELMELCVDAGHTIEEAEESPYGESVRSTRGNLVKEVGQLAGIVGRGPDPVVDFVANDIVVDFECTGDFVEAPTNGHFVGMHFSITTTPELADEVSPEFWISNHDFSVWNNDGRRINDPVGNAWSCLSSSDEIPSSIGPDESVEGWIVLDVPNETGVIGYSWIGIADGGWEWVYGQ